MAVKKEDGRRVEASYLLEDYAGRAVLLVDIIGDPAQLCGSLVHSAEGNETGKLTRILRERYNRNGMVYKVPVSGRDGLNEAVLFNTQRKISFKPLLHLLVTKEMTAADLRRAAGISPSTMTEIKANRSVTLDTIVKICNVLDCSIGDVVDII